MLLDNVTSNYVAELLEQPVQETWNILDSTKATAYLACPRKFFYEYVLGWKPDMPSNHLVFGHSLHIALEHLLLHGMAPSKVLEAYDLFLLDYRKTYGPETDELFEPKTPRNALLVLLAYARTWCNDENNYEVLYTEIGGSVSIGDDRLIYFKMDSLLRNKNTGKYLSLDHKTASSFYSWTDQFLLSIQTGTYTHVLYCLYPEEVYGIVYNGLQFGKSKKGWAELSANKTLSVKNPIDFMRIPVMLNLRQMNLWLDDVNEIYSQIQQDYIRLVMHNADDKILRAFYRRPTACSDYGSLCKYHDFCISWSNPLSRCHNTPMDFKIEHWNPKAEEVKHEFNI